MSVDGAAGDLEWSRAKLYRIEAGEVSLRTLDVTAMCSLYGSTPDRTEGLVALAKESKSKGWWHAYGNAVPEWFELYVGLEAAASNLRQFDSNLIPGLLQTEEYAEAVFRTKSGLQESEIQNLVTVRMERQQLIYRRRPAAPKLDVILDESVLRRGISDPSAMRRQLEFLLVSVEANNISLRVLPMSAGLHAASLTSGFVILEFGAKARVQEPTTVYSESITGSLYLDRPSEVATYCQIWDILLLRSLPEDESKQLIGKIMGELL
jgi:hypothetical protein